MYVYVRIYVFAYACTCLSFPLVMFLFGYMYLCVYIYTWRYDIHSLDIHSLEAPYGPCTVGVRAWDCSPFGPFGACSTT